MAQQNKAIYIRCGILAHFEGKRTQEKIRTFKCPNMRGDLSSKMERLYFQPFCPWCGTGMQGGLLLNPLAKKFTYIKKCAKRERGTAHRPFSTELSAILCMEI